MDYSDLAVLGLLFVALQAGAFVNILHFERGRYLADKNAIPEEPNMWDILAHGVLFVGIMYFYFWYRNKTPTI